MNNFRTLSESRAFISFGLLLLLLGIVAPVCEAASASQGVHSHVAEDSAHQDRHEQAVVLSHLDTTPHCCTDLNALANVLPVALVSFSIADSRADVGEVLPDFDLFIRISYRASRLAYSRVFHFKATELPLYLVTQRLRV